MTITTRAKYTKGVLYPEAELPFADGQNVDVIVASRFADQLNPRLFTAEEADYYRRMQEAKSIDEMFAVMETAPDFPDDYDLCRALNANRKAAGEMPIYPDLEAESKS